MVPLVVGGLTFAITQVWLLAASTGSGTSDPGWFLNGPDAGFAVMATVAIVSALIAALRPATSLEGAVAFGAGAVVAMIIVLFVTGPGTIFPIVIVVGTVVLSVATFVGSGLGWLLRTAWTRVTS